MDVNVIIKTMLLIGSDLPAYKALLEQVIALFNETDQAALKRSYADAIVASDQAHAAAQAL